MQSPSPSSSRRYKREYLAHLEEKNRWLHKMCVEALSRQRIVWAWRVTIYTVHKEMKDGPDPRELFDGTPWRDIT